MHSMSRDSPRSRLTFDVDLPREPADFRNEVIIHELVHMKVPNHGKLFPGPGSVVPRV
jgi:predicted metal-dependent hydrolase